MRGIEYPPLSSRFPFVRPVHLDVLDFLDFLDGGAWMGA